MARRGFWYRHSRVRILRNIKLPPVQSCCSQPVVPWPASGAVIGASCVASRQAAAFHDVRQRRRAQHSALPQIAAKRIGEAAVRLWQRLHGENGKRPVGVEAEAIQGVPYLLSVQRVSPYGATGIDPRR